ncbi:two-component system response regulator YcbB [Weissella beninensis]|uniref:Response regulator n=1 Tax=Periweissella beninensis TaxID=504936 RepID=A0ABT0VHC2_9LACO|nr:DNA-binding domain-containing protein [Periweissella beninensis]MBM7544468.1 two-component system response regulator YcbB [Periweissella beninensis]MCM2437056.1 response regulator [Periweissella beninensis]
MNFFIIDDDPSVPMILQRILEDDINNNVVGIAHTASNALNTILIANNIDIVLIDLLMPEISGIELIKQIKPLKPDLKFVMISQVHDSALRTQAYEAGIEFFIDKPINIIEVKTVIQNVIMSLQMVKKLQHIQNLLIPNNDHINTISTTTFANKEKILSVLRFLGITSEKGVSDILAIAQLMIDKNLTFREINFNTLYHIDDHEKKILFQRIRRAIKVGLRNLATLLLDDMGDELVIEYANALYEYKNVCIESQFLQNKRLTGGKVSLKHFFDGLVQESNKHF